MEEAETLRTVAAVGISLAGFTGIVSVLGRRARGDWSPIEFARMRLLLEASLGAVFFALILILLEMAVPAPRTAWRLSNAFLAAFHLSIIVHFFRRALMTAASNLPASERRVVYPLGFAGLSIIAAQLLACAGVIAEVALPYFLGLIWLLLIASVTFVYLLLPGRDGTPQ